MDLIALDDVEHAATTIAGVAVRTALLAAPFADGLWLKPESLQPIGAFKIRGATHAVASIPADQRAAGVVTHSSGNHGRALACAARAMAVPCVVVMPDVAPAVKVAAVRALGAEVELVAPADRLRRALQIVARRGMTLVPPFDHPDVIAGQGTVGLEIAADLPDVDLVLVPVGGGGLASGVATAMKALRPAAAIVGVEPELAADAQESLAAGQLVEWEVERTYRTVADGVRTNLSELTFAHLRARLDRIVTVSEEEILATTRTLVTEAKLVVEPSGAVATAAYLHRRAELPPATCTVAVISGGNIDPVMLATILAG